MIIIEILLCIVAIILFIYGVIEIRHAIVLDKEQSVQEFPIHKEIQPSQIEYIIGNRGWWISMLNCANVEWTNNHWIDGTDGTYTDADPLSIHKVSTQLSEETCYRNSIRELADKFIEKDRSVAICAYINSNGNCKIVLTDYITYDTYNYKAVTYFTPDIECNQVRNRIQNLIKTYLKQL